MMESGQQTQRLDPKGVAYAVVAFLIWGVLPLYWKMLSSVGAIEVLMHRILWSFAFTATLVLFRGQWKEARAVLIDPAKRRVVVLGAILIGLNWGIYIWAVMADQVVQTSLGYYINPLLSVLLGILAFRERLNFWQLVSFALAFAGVLVITVQHGKVPWISLSLALCFGLYGMIKKKAKIESAISLMLETATLLPLALGYLVYLQFRGTTSFGSSMGTTALLTLSGVLTAMPLLWFSQATQRIPLSTVGFTQYFTPTMMLIIGVVLYKEPFTRGHLLGFVLIWIALAVFSLSQLAWMHKFQPKWSGRSSAM